MGATAGGLTPKTGGGFMDKYFAFDSFEGFPRDVSVRDHAQYTPGGKNCFWRISKSPNQLRSIYWKSWTDQELLWEVINQKFCDQIRQRKREGVADNGRL